MGEMMLEQVLAIMKAGGIRTQRAYPGRVMPAVTETVAAVSLEKMDLTKGTCEVKVLIISPTRLGGGGCEDTAMATARALQSAGLSCQIKGVEFDGRSGHFHASVYVTMPQMQRQSNLSPFRIGAVEQAHVVSFTAQRQQTAGDSALTRSWSVQLEQFFPAGMPEDRDPDGEEFTLTNGTEVFHGCRWVKQKRVTEADGTRQIREGTAMERTFL